MYKDQSKTHSKQNTKDAVLTESKYKIFQNKKFLFASLIGSVFLVTMTNVIGNDAAKLNSNISFIVLPAILSILSVRLVVKFPSERRLLIGFALFSVLSAVAEDLFIFYESVLDTSPFPSIADGFWITGYVSLFAFFIAYLKPLKKIIPKKIVVLASLVTAGFLIPSVIQALSLNSDSDGLSLAVALAYPVIDAMILCPVIIGMTVLYRKKSDPFLFSMLVAILSFIVADSIYLVIYDSYENGNPIDIGWMIGYILFSYATVTYTKSRNQPTSLTVDLENNKIVSTVSSEAVIQFVIPFVVISLVMIGAIYLVDFYFKETTRNPEANLVPVYLFLSIFVSLLMIIFVINRNLMKIIKMRTKELENERDMLRLQNEEKNQLITKSRSLETQLQKSLLDLKNIERSKDEFIAMVTHELKTPLVPIKGYSELLLSGYVGTINEQQKERLDVIKSSSESLLRLINDLLDVQKIELGQLKLNMQKNNLANIIKEVINKINPLTERKSVTVIPELEENITCLCDKERIAQVLYNLLLNSVDFVPKESGKISIKLEHQNGEAEITIKDNGIGIEKEKLGKLFVKFYQIDTSNTREHKGTGLGLSISKGIVSSHGGKIWAESEGLGKGTEFHICLTADNALK